MEIVIYILRMCGRGMLLIKSNMAITEQTITVTVEFNQSSYVSIHNRALHTLFDSQLDAITGIMAQLNGLKT